MSPWNASQLALWVVVLFNLVLTYALIRRLGNPGGGGPAPWIGGLSAGAAAPDFEGETPSGELVSRRSLGSGGPLVLGFFSPTCTACEHQVPEFVAFAERAGARGVRVAAVLDAGPEESHALRALLPERVTSLLAPRATNPLLDSYHVYAYPSYTVVRGDGTVDGTYARVGELDGRLGGLVAQG